MKIAAAHNLAVIEDNAQAIGCDYTFSDGTTKKTGSICTYRHNFLFFPVKFRPVLARLAGAVTTNDDEPCR
jgi:dTDP-4-amino-4,6-dideoxygalactose transaminase